MIHVLRITLVVSLAAALLHALSAAQAEDERCNAACVARDYDSGAHVGGRCVCSSELEAAK